MTRRVLITGAASGLGAALAQECRRRGDRVLRTDRIVAHGIVELDVTKDADWERVRHEVLENWGGLDVLINNAGIAGGGRIDRCTMPEWERLTEVNLFGVVRGCRALTPLFKEQGSGTIINVASLAGLVHPAGMGSYNAVKAAVVALTETLGHELAQWGITAHAVCPSYFKTNLTASLEGADEAVGRVIARLVEHSPVTAEEIAAGILDGVAAGQELILPDVAAQAAYQLKIEDRPGYDAVMRAQATKLEAASE